MNIEIIRCISLYGGNLALLKKRLNEIPSFRDLSPIQQECVFEELKDELLKSRQVNS